MNKSALLVPLLALAVACPDKPVTPPDAGQPKPKATERPPFPTMATPAWGERVIEKLAAEADPALSGQGFQPALDKALAALRSDEEDSAQRLVRAAAAGWRAAMSDRDRSTAAALAGVGLCLDSRVDGFKERLTDAYGLTAYAGTLDGTVTAQAARAFVSVAVGRTNDGEKLVDILTRGDVIEPDSAFMLGLARVYAGKRNDQVLGLLERVLADRPDHVRARITLARVYLDLHAAGEVERITIGHDVPALIGLRGRALVVAGNREEGIKLLREASARAKPPHQSEVLYWLGRSLTDKNKTEALDVLSKISGRPGYGAEANLLTALIAQHGGDYARAKTFAEKVTRSRGVPLTLALDAQWALVNACAGLGDIDCVGKEGVAAVERDGDAALLAHARAAASIVGGNESVDQKAALLEAHRLSPFDPGLAKHVSDGVSSGGDALKTQVRASRRALAFGASELATKLMEAPAKTNQSCRVCRALRARAAKAPGEMARRAVKVLDGPGPKLALSDLLDVVPLLGRAEEPAAKKALTLLMKHENEEVRRAAQKAQAAVAVAKPGHQDHP